MKFAQSLKRIWNRTGKAESSPANPPVTHDGFDEAWYLANNGDAKAAVDAGVFVSGRQHYEAHGRAEGRSGGPGDRPDKKMDIIHYFAKHHGKRDYVELCTPTTGTFYNSLCRGMFHSSRRLMYQCPPVFDDGMRIDYRVEGLDIAAAVRQMAGDRVPDICLVDGWHTYEHTLRDLATMHSLFPDGGVLVVHDLLPHAEEETAPDWIPGAWVGVAYKAFLDFVLTNELDYCTLDADYGCGIIVKNKRLAPIWPVDETGTLKAEWLKVSATEAAPYHYFMEHHEKLLRLVSVEAFVEGFGIL